MRIAIGADHAGFESKERLKKLVAGRNHEVADLGTGGTASVDYPDFAFRVAQAVARGEADRGILICGTGIGMSIAANKVRGVRAAVCASVEAAEMSRRHNDANVLCLGARLLDPQTMDAVALQWLDAPFDGGRHAGRVEKIRSFEASSTPAPGAPRPLGC